MNLTMARTCDAAPVQYEGTIEGKFFFFHARHNEWSFCIADTLEEAIDGFSEREVFVKRGRYGSDQNPGYGVHAASYMPHEEAERLIRACSSEYIFERNK
jgi:hypothetical protein